MAFVSGRVLALCALAVAAGCTGNAPNIGAATPDALHGESHVAGTDLQRQVSARFPVIGDGRESAAYRPANPAGPRSVLPQTKGGAWKQLATLPGAVIHDIAFASPSTGFAAAELGQVWKTADGGKTWNDVLNLGFPYYFYGVTALSAKDVVVSGFDDTNYEGVLRWSHDGGTTWSSDVVLTTTGWSDRIRFASHETGLVVDQLDTQAANAVHYTTDGGAGPGDWTELVPDPQGGWFGDEFSLLANGQADMSGINYCSSPNAGRTWSCGPAIDSVFDGPVFFYDKAAGWVGGGEISPSVAGWVHRTSDGGTTWSGRTLNSPFPIREVFFISPTLGWAAGGNIYSDVGGIYASKDGGRNWTLELNTNGYEMKACAKQPAGNKTQIWCAGYDSALNGIVYTTTR